MKYLTDGRRLYEVAAERTVENFGLARRSRPTIRYVILRDAVTEAVAKVDDVDLLALEELRAA